MNVMLKYLYLPAVQYTVKTLHTLFCLHCVASQRALAGMSD